MCTPSVSTPCRAFIQSCNCSDYGRRLGHGCNFFDNGIGPVDVCLARMSQTVRRGELEQSIVGDRPKNTDVNDFF